MYDSLVVPTDGSRQLAEVVDQVIDLASLCDATPHAVHVVDARAYYPLPEDACERVPEMLCEGAESFTRAVAERTLAVDLEVI